MTDSSLRSWEKQVGHFNIQEKIFPPVVPNPLHYLLIPMIHPTLMWIEAVLLPPWVKQHCEISKASLLRSAIEERRRHKRVSWKCFNCDVETVEKCIILHIATKLHFLRVQIFAWTVMTWRMIHRVQSDDWRPVCFFLTCLGRLTESA